MISFIVGVDIAAGEEHFDSDNFPHLHHPHLDAFKKAKDLNVNITMHAGEVGKVDYVLRAIDDYGAKRIGHGYRIVDDPEKMAKILKRGVHFEVCPTSSVETGAWDFDKCQITGKKLWKNHPVKTMIEFGFSVGLNTDDPSVFDTDLGWQYRIATSKMGLSVEHLVRTIFHSVDAAFCEENVKKSLREDILSFLNNNNLISEF